MRRTILVAWINQVMELPSIQTSAAMAIFLTPEEADGDLEETEMGENENWDDIDGQELAGLDSNVTSLVVRPDDFGFDSGYYEKDGEEQPEEESGNWWQDTFFDDEWKQQGGTSNGFQSGHFSGGSLGGRAVGDASDTRFVAYGSGNAADV